MTLRLLFGDLALLVQLRREQAGNVQVIGAVEQDFDGRDGNVDLGGLEDAGLGLRVGADVRVGGEDDGALDLLGPTLRCNKKKKKKKEKETETKEKKLLEKETT